MCAQQGMVDGVGGVDGRAGKVRRVRKEIKRIPCPYCRGFMYYRKIGQSWRCARCKRVLRM